MSWRKYKCGSVWSEVSFRKQIALAFFPIGFAAHCSRVVWSTHFYCSTFDIFVNKSEESSRPKACSLSHSKYILILKSGCWNCLISELAGLLRSCLICSGRRSQRISMLYIYIALFIYLSIIPSILFLVIKSKAPLFVDIHQGRWSTSENCFLKSVAGCLTSFQLNKIYIL